MTFLRNLGIGAKLVLAFAIVLGLAALLGGFSILRLGQVNATATELESNWMPGSTGALQLKAALARYRIQELQYLLAEDDAVRTRYEQRMKDHAAKAASAVEGYRKLADSPAETAIQAELEDLWQRYQQAHEKVIAQARAGKGDEARALMRSDSLALSNAINERVERLVKFNEDGAQSASESGAALYGNARLSILIQLGVTIALGLGLALWIARLVARPLGDAVTVAQKVAGGDLTSRIEARSTDETGRLLEALQAMNAGLVRIVGEVRGGAETIAAASKQLATGNQDLSARTEQQAGSLEETASAMEELTGTVRQNAENARQANTLALAASQVAARGGSVVQEVVATMSAINASASRIAEITSVIDAIAFQTNILALNAAVEAARAGEQGRGFAVVAGEVRTLAQRSANAAKEIKELISGSVEQVEHGTRLVDNAGATMQDIVQSVARVTDIMNEIAAASDEQTAGIEQINRAIIHMDEATQQNAALVEQATAASDAMQEQAARLAETVGTFRLEPGAVAVRAPQVVAKARTVKPAPRTTAIAPVERKRSLATAGDEWTEF
ncbi:methyl-accepting chemotaxis protein [Oxalobacteraceae bacterium OM1]|nr:methyl-accepting chemotaxis protein [Oxalobacteraceae bacterium OM1]